VKAVAGDGVLPFLDIKRSALLTAAMACLVAGGLTAGVAAQQSPNNIPDAPSAAQPPKFPTNIPPSTGGTPSEAEGQKLPPNQAPPGDSSSSDTNPDGAGAAHTPPPMKVDTVPEGGATPDAAPANEQLYKLTVNVNQIVIPLMVKDENGRLVPGLLPKDVLVFEDGKRQELNYFTSDPFALSAAVVLDLGMPDVAVQKVNKTFSALEGAFANFDEVEIYTYSNTVGRASDFRGAGRQLAQVLNDLSTVTGSNNGPPVTGGPLGPEGPTINGVPVDPQTPGVITPTKQAHVLNDAVLAAALDLSKRDRSRRKVIFVISDGREYRSNANYKDVLKVLLSANILVYGIGVEGAAIPLYDKVEKIHLPKFGYSDILPKYANATGGEVFNEFTRRDMEDIYSRVIGDARNQYTLGYASRATPSSAYREIEVRVANHGPSCKTAYRPCIDVSAKAGYYPLPPAPSS